MKALRLSWLQTGTAPFWVQNTTHTVHGAGFVLARADILGWRYHQGLGDKGNGSIVKGASVLQMLRGMLGEDVFGKAFNTTRKTIRITW